MKTKQNCDFKKNYHPHTPLVSTQIVCKCPGNMQKPSEQLEVKVPWGEERVLRVRVR